MDQTCCMTLENLIRFCVGHDPTTEGRELCYLGTDTERRRDALHLSGLILQESRRRLDQKSGNGSSCGFHKTFLSALETGQRFDNRVKASEVFPHG
jgi:hypothetical protein